jgi:hypothetical protein
VGNTSPWALLGVTSRRRRSAGRSRDPARSTWSRARYRRTTGATRTRSRRDRPRPATRRAGPDLGPTTRRRAVPPGHGRPDAAGSCFLPSRGERDAMGVALAVQPQPEDRARPPQLSPLPTDDEPRRLLMVETRRDTMRRASPVPPGHAVNGAEIRDRNLDSTAVSQPSRRQGGAVERSRSTR